MILRRPIVPVAIAVGVLLVAAGAWRVFDAGGSSPDPAPITASDSLAAADTVVPRVPHPPYMLGVWHHGDEKSQYGDSLTLVLRANGTASLLERHYTLDRAGWHLARVEREGGWAMTYRGTRVELCTKWATPTAMDSCARLTLLADSVAGDTSLMEYAGRHWRMRAASAGAGAWTARR